MESNLGKLLLEAGNHVVDLGRELDRDVGYDQVWPSLLQQLADVL
jgi:hypothetical protein